MSVPETLNDLPANEVDEMFIIDKTWNAFVAAMREAERARA